MKRQVIIFGTAFLGKSAYQTLTNRVGVEILAFADNNSSVWGNKLYDVEIWNPTELIHYPNASIIIASTYYIDINEQLLQMGIYQKQIYLFSHNNMISSLENYDILLDQNALIKPKEDFADYFNHMNLYMGKNELFMISCLYFESNYFRSISNINDAERKIFSQNGEDGIIQWILSRIKKPVKRFIEFGIGDYTESNTRFLLQKDKYNGLVIDGSTEQIKKARKIFQFDRNITICEAFITKENINQLFEKYNFTGEIGILSIDIDGNDFWIWDAINCVNPQVVICEYNAWLRYDKAITIPYCEDQVWDGTALFGASLSAFHKLGKKKGYSLIGTDSTAVNAFFIRDDLMENFEEKVPLDCRKTLRSEYELNQLVLDFVRDREFYDLDNSCLRKCSEIFEL